MRVSVELCELRDLTGKVSEDVRNEWLEAFRQAKDELLADLGTLNTCKEHTLRKHRRRSLHAAPSLPDVFEQSSSDVESPRCFYRGRASSASSYLQADAIAQPEDSSFTDATIPAVEHENFVAAVWLPDGSTDKCMRCGDTFTLWRRRHHCRLCGVVCCHLCTTRVSAVLRHYSWTVLYHQRLSQSFRGNQSRQDVRHLL